MNEEKANKLKYNPFLDFMRFIAALVVISIHIFPEGSTTESVGLDNSIPTLFAESFVYSFLQTAVPIFFVISSFLLFSKIKLDPENKGKHVGLFCLRILFLYLFWFVAALPITTRDIIGFTSTGDNYGLIRYFVLILWKGAPRGFWFLNSLAFSVFIVSLVKGKKSLITLIIIASLLYTYGCFNTTYLGVFTLSDDPFSKAMFNISKYLELSFCHLQALMYVTIGKIFAIHGTFKIKGNVVLIVLIPFLMVSELFITLYTGLAIYPNSFFTLPLFIFLFMNKMLTINIDNESFKLKAKKLKKVGSFSFLFHLQFLYYLYWICSAVGRNIFMENYFLLIIPYLFCVLLSFGLQTLFEYLFKYKYLRFLRYSY